jgi:methionine synthase I (cobalamin-dependent)
VICAEGYLFELERRGAGADVVGLNCSRGPATMLLAIERIR